MKKVKKQQFVFLNKIARKQKLKYFRFVLYLLIQLEFRPVNT